MSTSSSPPPLPEKYKEYDTTVLHPDTLRNCRRKQYEQHTPEWHEVRKTLLTASMLADVLRMPKSEHSLKGYQSYLQQFQSFKKKPSHGYCGYDGLRKAWLKRHHVPWSGGGQACHWGTRFESVANALYTKIKKTKILEYGLIIHDKFPWLGVSPDGITTDGHLVEIKCPMLRMITDDGYCSLIYWIQCQLQIELCDMEKPLHFWQCQFQLYENKQAYLEDEKVDEEEHLKGAFVQLNEVYCLYPDYEAVAFNSVDMVKWAEATCASELSRWESMSVETRNTLEKPQPDPPTVVYWKTQKIRCTVIERCREWFNVILPESESVFSQLQDPTSFEFEQQEIADIMKEEEKSKEEIYKPVIRSEGKRSLFPAEIGLNLIRNSLSQPTSAAYKRKTVENSFPTVGASPKKFKLPSGMGLQLGN